VAGFAAYGVFAPSSPTELQPPGKGGALIWGDGIFASKAELRPWLRVHGGTYPVWKARHPAALRLLTTGKHRHAVKRRHVRPTAPTKAAAARKRAAATSNSATRASAAAQSRRAGGTRAPRVLEARPNSRNWVLTALAALGLLIACAAALPTFVLLRIGLSPRGEGRVLAATTGGAILLGVAVATLLN
jgi:hypothetical protein